MKHIVKDQNTPEFDEWKASANDDWQPTYEDLRGTTRIEVKNSLMKEQGSICCYCERRLTDDGSHIEHFNPRSNNAVNPLDYANMLCSCQNRLEQGEPRYCGHLKGDWFDNQLLVSPLDPGCEGHFAYTADGEIQPARGSDDAARMTIEKLGLNSTKLSDRRKKEIDPFLDENLSEREFSQFVSGYLRKNTGGMFGEFWTTIDYIFVRNVQNKER
ncbi:MAG: retron system putative HNH endonuclease [Euryarchaeota archaeon]|nr:retron system putative HNH endonuclease [Euryarchaeota archaeon]